MGTGRDVGDYGARCGPGAARTSLFGTEGDTDPRPEDVNLLLDEVLESIPVLRRGKEGRTLILADLFKVDLVKEKHLSTELSRAEDFRSGAGANISVDRMMRYVGGISDINDLIIDPYTMGCREDHGQMIHGQCKTSLVRSKAEINYQCRYAEGSNTKPRAAAGTTPARTGLFPPGRSPGAGPTGPGCRPPPPPP